MVAISMYRGNLHKVPDVPRRWTMPDRNLSFKEFKSLLHRRKRALSRLFPSSNPNPSQNVKLESVTDAIPSERPGSSGKEKLVEVKREEVNGNQVRGGENGGIERDRAGGGSDGGDRVMELLSNNGTDNNVPHEEAAEAKETAEEVVKVPSEIEKEEKQVEERLQVLNAKKHNLVQVLKLILNAEEELKRRSSSIPQQQAGATASRPSLPLHVDVSSNDAGAHNMEGGETDGAGNHNNNAQNPSVVRLCGASSSSESPLRRAAAAFSQHNMAPHPSRWSPRVVGPTQPGNTSAAGVTVSASGTNYIASSPSPAGSGGTSVFRETRLQSPGN